VTRHDPPTTEAYEATFDAIRHVSDRWGVTRNDAEVFLESVGYFGGEFWKNVNE